MIPVFLITVMLVLSACSSPAPSDAEINAVMAHDRRSRSALVDDYAISVKINEALSDEKKALIHSHISSLVYNGRVLLAGEVADEPLHTRLIETVRTLSKVKEVHDNLATAPALDSDLQSQDLATRERLETALMQIRTLDAFDSTMIKVLVEGGAVYLMGLVHRNEGAVVVNVIRHQPGVQKIVTVFDYLD